MEQARQVQVAAAGPSRLEFLAASTMCRLQAEACNVDRDDLWKLHSDEFYADAREVLKALGDVQTEAYAEGRKDEADENGAASRLIDAWAAAHGKPVPWEKAVEIVAIANKLPDAERARLLALAED